MNVQSIGGKEFLVIDTFEDRSKHLNPFSINIKQIRYIREYTDEKIKNAWAVFVGEKMYPTIDALGINNVIPGDIVKIGSEKFLCAEGNSLTGASKCRYLINFDNVLYMRKFVNKDKPNKNDINDVKEADNFNKFAIVTIDDRIITVNFAKAPIDDVSFEGLGGHHVKRP